MATATRSPVRGLSVMLLIGVVFFAGMYAINLYSRETYQLNVHWRGAAPSQVQFTVDGHTTSFTGRQLTGGGVSRGADYHKGMTLEIRVDQPDIFSVTSLVITVNGAAVRTTSNGNPNTRLYVMYP